MSYQVHWNEGLFLQPHHFQQMQRGLFAQLEKMRRRAQPYAYGISELEVSEDELENNLLRFRRLAGVMQSGTEFAFPGNSNLPTLDLGSSSAVRGDVVTILLGLPLWQENRANCAVTDDRQTALGRFHYALLEKEVMDENTGTNEKPLAFRVLNARLLLDGDDRSDLEVIPLVRLLAASGDRAGRYRLDHDFIGPCLTGNASPRLYNIIQDTAHLLDGARAELMAQVTRTGFAGDTVYGRTLEAVMRLGSLTRAAARMKPLLAASGVTPFAWYLELVSLLADLSIFSADQEVLIEGEYEHENILPVFMSLHAKLKSSLKATAPAATQRIEFKKTDVCYTASLADAQLQNSTEFYLVIRTKQDSRLVTALLEDRNRFKIMPPSRTRAALFGMELKREEIPPPHLNVPRGSMTFRLVRSSNPERWKEIETEKCMTAYWQEHRASDFEIALQMTLPA
jgi:type VI secretion system protein ImpJ